MEKIKLLIVDDEEEFAATLAERLELRGFISKGVSCGNNALEALASNFSPDVVLLDLKMPDMNGFEVLIEIKEKYPSIEVIMLTGHGAATGGKDSKERGAFDFIMKPVDIIELTDKIKSAYQKKESNPGKH
ncbi:MAG: response regulator [Desulfobulbaceae bacterium]|nr:response regulator [Desulfobulbaceae bacterium]